MWPRSHPYAIQLDSKDSYSLQPCAKIRTMEAKILVNIDGYGTAEMNLELVDPPTLDDTVEVWRATFTEREHPQEIISEVYFEMEDSDYEIWDLVNSALYSYLDETK